MKQHPKVREEYLGNLDPSDDALVEQAGTPVPRPHFRKDPGVRSRRTRRVTDL